MLTQEDKIQLQQKGISESQIERQLKQFREGFPFLRLKAAASVENGILRTSLDEQKHFVKLWDQYKKEGHKITKFVPASGAASRMFKAMFEFVDADYDVPTTDFEKKFFDRLHDFAFFPALDDACVVMYGKGADALVAEGRQKDVVVAMLDADGLNYGQLPKGLLQFHSYDTQARTPLEEHLVEAALYASSKGEADVHFTVSSEHKALFQQLVKDVLGDYEKEYGVRYHVSFSEQKPSTDTLAATMDNEPFRVDGKLLFRPGGHGALIENLSDLDSDIVSYLRLLDSGDFNHSDLEDMIRFVRHTLCCDKEGLKDMEDTELVNYLRSKLNRPMRAAGVVKNVGEPGGGPFLAYNPDGSISLQILESSQIDQNNAEYQKMFTEGTHFNPVDLVCAIRDYKGNKFDLPKYVDPATGFISFKSKSGRELKALELPGLWNGAMSDWSTIMVEVPLATFNPVKTVNDLLRDQHQ